MTLSQPMSESILKWLSEDPDPATRLEIHTLWERYQEGNLEAEGELQRRFSSRLTFGTAGIRGPVRAGPTGMNRVVVCQTTAGLATYLLQKRAPADGTRLRVVVGCDARTNSDVFHQDTLEVLSGYGIEAISVKPQLPTPVLAFAVRELHADAGIMITASHNPPADNGYKVYFGGDDEGSQIVSPHDRHIEDHIAAVVTDLSFARIPRSTTYVVSAPESLERDYIASTKRALSLTNMPTKVRAVYTPLHGVGAHTFLAAAQKCGFSDIHTVTEQVKPDPLFPSVAFPNPEEKGALDLSMQLARNIEADIILANDPDADRLALALRDDSSDTGYTALTGNQIGAILGWRAGLIAKSTGATGALANSLVSSPILGKIAAHFGLTHQETLTGFKYVSRVPHLLFGFEEALGYLVTPEVVRDKDGISAALAILDLANDLARQGRTLWDYLDDIESAVGGFASTQITIALAGQSDKPSVSGMLRAQPPSMLGSQMITRTDDFSSGFEGFPPENIIRYFLEGGSRIIVRPSGTEPKLKVYLDSEGRTREEAESSLRRLEEAMRQLIEELQG